MFNKELLSKKISEQTTLDILGKTYEIKNCVKVIDDDLIKLCLFLTSDDSSLTISLDVREYDHEYLLEAKHV